MLMRRADSLAPAPAAGTVIEEWAPRLRFMERAQLSAYREAAPVAPARWICVTNRTTGFPYLVALALLTVGYAVWATLHGAGGTMYVVQALFGWGVALLVCRVAVDQWFNSSVIWCAGGALHLDIGPIRLHRSEHIDFDAIRDVRACKSGISNAGGRASFQVNAVHVDSTLGLGPISWTGLVGNLSELEARWVAAKVNELIELERQVSTPAVDRGADSES